MAIQAAIGAWNLFKKKEKPYSAKKAVLVFIGGVFVVSVAVFPTVLFPQYIPLEPTSALTVKTTEFVWTDESRAETFTNSGEKRFVNAAFWYPEEEGSYPLAVFSHGAFGFNGTNISTFEDLASNGYVVASIGHPYHAFYTQSPGGDIVLPDAGFINSVYAINNMDDGPEQKAITDGWLDVRVKDIDFVLETIIDQPTASPSDELFGKIDTGKIGLFGHSLGAAASVEVGRLRSDIGAVIAIDGTMLGEDASGEAPYPVPVLDMMGGYHYRGSLPAGEEYPNFHMTAQAEESYRAVLEGAGHLSFCDLALFSPALANFLSNAGVTDAESDADFDARQGLETVNGWVLGFFDYALKDGPPPDFGGDYQFESNHQAR